MPEESSDENWLERTIEDSVEETASDDNEHGNFVPFLIILSGVDQGKRFRLDAGKHAFGRNPDVDIILYDVKMSRTHGSFIVGDSWVEVEDNASTNGIYVDNQRVMTRAKITPDTRVQIGSTIMKVVLKDAAEIAFESALFEAATTDALTGISNRRAFLDMATQEVAFAKRKNTFLTVVMLDVDHFKQKNDTFGHQAGDYILQEMSKLMQRAKREEDILGRYGGEEFILLLRDTDEDEARIFCERLRKSIEEFWFEFEDKEMPTTVSMGLCARQGDDIVTLKDLIKVADTALYEAKEGGRNRLASS